MNFTEKVRNDYPSSLYERINRFRLPFNELLSPQISKRLSEIKKLGFEYTFYHFGEPNKQILDLISVHNNLIDKIEIVLAPLISLLPTKFEDASTNYLRKNTFFASLEKVWRFR